MSVTAKQLSRSGAKGKDLDAVVREQLLIIDDRLQRTERTWGRNVLAHDLPTNFAFPGLEKKNAQRIIYAAVVKSLLDRGFVARLLLEADRTVLLLEWVTDLNSEEIDAMNDLISRVRIAPEDVKGFCARGRESLAEPFSHPAVPRSVARLPQGNGAAFRQRPAHSRGMP